MGAKKKGNKAMSREAALADRAASRGYSLEKDGKHWYAVIAGTPLRADGEPGRGRRVPPQGGLMRYTEEKNSDLRTVPAHEIWVGVVPADKPYIAIASRLDEDVVIACRFSPTEAWGMAQELIRLAASIEAPRN
jgi:hypothetical protein